jgi:hypothetical protein
MAGDYSHLRAVLAGPVPDLIISTWQEVAADHVATNQYRSYLTFEKLFPEVGPDSLAVHVANTAPYARVLEDGHAAFHLPSRIDWGQAITRGTAKVSKTGTRYLRVPFRHFTPAQEGGGVSAARARAMMTPDTYKLALAASRGDKSARKRLHQEGTQLSRPYRIIPGVPAELLRRAQHQEGQPGYTWHARTYEGLRREEQKTPGGSAGSTWLTFRTLTEDSVGWFIPAMSGFHFAQRVMDLVRDPIQKLVGEAARADLADIISVQIGGTGAAA